MNESGSNDREPGDKELGVISGELLETGEFVYAPANASYASLNYSGEPKSSATIDYIGNTTNESRPMSLVLWIWEIYILS